MENSRRTRENFHDEKDYTLSLLEKHIYPYLPVPIQNAAISAFGYNWQRRRFGGNFSSYYEAFKQREKFSIEQWKDYQTQELQKLLVHAFDNVGYYQDAFTKAGITRPALNSFQLSDIAALPVLEKPTLRQEGKDGLLSTTREKGGSFFASSGSTGTPVNILYSHPFHQRISALYEARVRNWAGVSRHYARAMIGGRRIIPHAQAKPPYYRYNAAERQVYFSAYHIAPNNVEDYLAGLSQHNVQYLVGYAMSIFLLAKFVEQTGKKAPALKAVLTSSEKLTPAMRHTISKVFQCKVYDAWSGVEWCGLISENEYGQLLISPDSAIIEVLKPNGQPALPGEEGELVCTGLLNYDQPLIRYKIGDVVKLANDQTTQCGRIFTVVEEIMGRTEEVVTGADGRQMVRFHSVFLNLPNVHKAQVVQHSLQQFEVKVATPGLTTEEKDLICTRMKSQLGEVNILISEVDDIAAGPNGKFKAVISYLKNHEQED